MTSTWIEICTKATAIRSRINIKDFVSTEIRPQVIRSMVATNAISPRAIITIQLDRGYP